MDVGTVTKEQRSELIKKLEEEGFKVIKSGNVPFWRIHVANPEPTHPVTYSGIYQDYAHDPDKQDLPVGAIYENEVSLANEDETFPKDYHSQIKQIFETVAKPTEL